MWSRNKTVFFCLSFLFSLFVGSSVVGQNLFDCEHSRSYADYLFSVQDYERASNEYERILYSCDTASIRHLLLKSYRLSGRYPQAFRQLNRLYPQVGGAPDFARQEYLKLTMLTARYSQVDSLLKTNFVSPTDTRIFQLKNQVLTNRWSEATQQLATLDSNQLINRSEYGALLEKAQQFRPKKPWVAGALSTVIPGLGKVYARDRKDGIISFIFIGSLAYQAYRAFNRRGSDSVAGWIFTGAGIGFHLGNIYGSVKSARQYNQRQLQQLNHEAKRLSFSDF